MSLMRTLARVAVGVAAAKGASALARNAKAGRSGTMLDDMMNRGTNRGGASRMGSTGGLGGGLGGLLDSLQNKGSGQRGGGLGSSGSAGGLAGMIGGLLGGDTDRQRSRPDTRNAGGLGGLAGSAGLGGIVGALAGARSSGGFGRSLQSELDDTPVEHTAEEEGLAAVMLLAMVQAAQSDGNLDATERARITDQLGDATPEERRFVGEAMDTRIDTAEIVAQVPEGAEAQVYTMAVLAIDLDHPAEVDFLRDFADRLGLDKAVVNEIHDKVGASPLY
ncbi:Uncharacterized membrane protein YebE, DUF533 family [Loktanella fryxellensis]|uniref:Uncharacterized membrane protein YebE, DUF533 family n=1 Tax=Loktanella fryxellensis TaxID=245187 RepID=A0A1H7YH94_9RHOB|nr:DUF533 domain-containing protein [Loktanella fryxellensis]SEM45264.1 Uncharacterized membrane protein YebE, DUF533 family [Loktanella fryxellensis]